MSPVEVEFSFILPLLLLLYWGGPRRVWWQNGVLLVASYIFFASWSGQLLIILIATTALNFWLARRLASGAAVPATHASTRRLFWTGIVLNLLELALFKYAGFFARTANLLLGAVHVQDGLPVWHLVASVGLSFRTLQNIGFLSDAYLGRQEAPTSLLDFAVFSAFFPQMLAGPIVRGHEMMPQYGRARVPDPSQWGSGAATFLLGFALKAFAADIIGQKLVDPVFATPDAYGVVPHWLALVGFALQVFSDFAGYSLIAIGMGRLCGLELPTNFNFPFISRSLPEFWRRWHITLNTWLFDYIFVPLTVSSRWFRGRMIPAFFITFAISGLWHGAAWTFVIWGLLQGAGLSAHYLWERQFRTLAKADRSWVARRNSAAFALLAWAVTQAFFILTLVPFRTSSLTGAINFGRGLIVSPGADGVRLTSPHLMAAVLLVVGYQLVPTAVGTKLWRRFCAFPPFARGLAYGLAVAFLVVFTPQGSGSFIYAQF